MANRKPAQTIRHANVKAAVWENTGKNGTFYSVTFARSYKIGNDWKDSNSFSGLFDLTNLVQCAFDAYRFIATHNREALPEV